MGLTDYGSLGIVLHFPDSTLTEKEYHHIISALKERGLSEPIGREYHIAYIGPDGSIKVLDVWDSKENLRKFVDQLMPVIEQFGYSPGEPRIFQVSNITIGA